MSESAFPCVDMCGGGVEDKKSKEEKFERCLTVARSLPRISRSRKVVVLVLEVIRFERH